MSNRTLDALRRRLEKLELEHLNQHITELQEKLERAERRAQYAEDCADMWRENCMDLTEQLQREYDMSIGMTKDGDLFATQKSLSDQQ